MKGNIENSLHSLEEKTLGCGHEDSVGTTAKLLVMTVPMNQNGKIVLYYSIWISDK